jgi:tRNA G18 (ribose-2'-O)-methylase SpoU
MSDFVLILPNIRSRFNVGSFFRTADGSGVKKIYLTGITPAPPHPQIDKVALGAERFLPFEKKSQAAALIKKLKREGYQIVAVEQNRKSVPYFQAKFKKKISLIVGNEIKGLPKSILDLADLIVEIPMRGKKESLNVAVAGGIIMFDIAKKIFT